MIICAKLNKESKGIVANKSTKNRPDLKYMLAITLSFHSTTPVLGFSTVEMKAKTISNAKHMSTKYSNTVITTDVISNDASKGILTALYTTKSITTKSHMTFGLLLWLIGNQLSFF